MIKDEKIMIHHSSRFFLLLYNYTFNNSSLQVYIGNLTCTLYYMYKHLDLLKTPSIYIDHWETNTIDLIMMNTIHIPNYITMFATEDYSLEYFGVPDAQISLKIEQHGP